MNYQPEYGWLIETEKLTGIVWWSGSGWTTNSIGAIRFARKQDAEIINRLYSLQGIATEHMWCNGERDYVGGSPWK